MSDLEYNFRRLDLNKNPKYLEVAKAESTKLKAFMDEARSKGKKPEE